MIASITPTTQGTQSEESFLRYENITYNHKEGDWRKALRAEQIIEHVTTHKSEELKIWRQEWEAKLLFGEELNTTQREQLTIVLFAHKEIIALNPKAPKPIRGVEHTIPFKPGVWVKPFKARLRRLSPVERAAQDRETQQLLDNGLVRPSTSPWAAGTVLVPKKDGGLRYAIDYRELNKFTHTDAHPLPRCDDVCDTVNGCYRKMSTPPTQELPQLIGRMLPTIEKTKEVGVKEAWDETAQKIGWTSTFDLAAGFHGVPLREEDKHKTAFATWTHGLLEWNVMAMGLAASSSTFQRAMQNVLRGLHWRIVIAYLDDGSVFSEGFDQHLDDLVLVFERLSAANISIKISKCKWGTKRLPLLGHLIVAGEGVLPDEAKTQAIQEMKQPRTIGELKSFLGATGYYRRFIPDYSSIGKPLRRLSNRWKSKNTAIRAEWNKDPAHQAAFEALKAALANAPVLKAPDFEKPFIVLSDASKEAIGCVLVQLDETGKERPISFLSRALQGPEERYAITDLEGLAMVTAIRQFRHYVHGNSVVAITDHAALTGLMTKTELGSARQARYSLDLQEYDLTVCYRPGALMHLPDTISRIPTTWEQVAAAPEGPEREARRHEAAFPWSHLVNTSRTGDANLVGSAAAAYQDSKIFSAEALQAMLSARVKGGILPEGVEESEGVTSVAELVASREADRHRRNETWRLSKRADPDPSITQERLDAICSAVTEQRKWDESLRRIRATIRGNNLTEISDTIMGEMPVLASHIGCDWPTLIQSRLKEAERAAPGVFEEGRIYSGAEHEREDREAELQRAEKEKGGREEPSEAAWEASEVEYRTRAHWRKRAEANDPLLPRGSNREVRACKRRAEGKLDEFEEHASEGKVREAAQALAEAAYETLVGLGAVTNGETEPASRKDERGEARDEEDCEVNQGGGGEELRPSSPTVQAIKIGDKVWVQARTSDGAEACYPGTVQKTFNKSRVYQVLYDGEPAFWDYIKEGQVVKVVDAEAGEEEETARRVMEEGVEPEGGSSTGEATNDRGLVEVPSRLEFRQAQRDSPKWGAMARHLESAESQPEKGPFEEWVRRHDSVYDVDDEGLLWRWCIRDEEGRLPPVRQLVVPDGLKEQVIWAAHAGLDGGHSKVAKTWHKLRERYFWPAMRTDIMRVIKTCPICQLHGISKGQAPVLGHASAPRAGHTWMIDGLHFVESSDGFVGCLVAIDGGTRSGECRLSRVQDRRRGKSSASTHRLHETVLCSHARSPVGPTGIDDSHQVSAIPRSRDRGGEGISRRARV